MKNFCTIIPLPQGDLVRLSTNRPKLIGSIKKAREKYPEAIKIIIEEQPEGIFTAHIPNDWITVRPPLQLTNEERERRSERMKGLARKRWNKNR